MSTLHSSPHLKRERPDGPTLVSRESKITLTGSQKRYIYMADEFDHSSLGASYYEKKEAYLEASVGGSLVTVRPERLVKRNVEPGQGGEKRGLVTGFSSASRRRLMRVIASVERAERPVFVTLTYPDEFDDNMSKWKRDIDVLGKRLLRKVAGVGFVWRIEFKERQSGKSSGRIAPHFHLLIYNASYRELRTFIPDAWYDIVGSLIDDHLRAGTRVEKIHSFGGIMRYVGKYITKVDGFPGEWTGRAWGIIGRESLPWAVRVVISLSEDEGKRLIRLGRKMMRLKGKTLVHGVTWIVNTESVLDYLELLQGFT